MVEKVFARIENNRVVEYPITVATIRERNNPAEVYIEVFYNLANPPQDIPLYQKRVEVVKWFGPFVYIDYEITYRTVEEMFQYLSSFAMFYDENQQPVVNRTQITPEIYDAFEIVVKRKVQSLMDAFAGSRGYDDMFALCNYAASTEEQQRLEAQRGIYLRDVAWRTLYSEFAKMKQGLRPIATSWSDIGQHLPEFTWGEGL